MIKKNMKNPDLGDRQRRILDFRQTAIKLVANTMYGYTAANFSGRMPMAELADTIVRNGSDILIDFCFQSTIYNRHKNSGDF